MENWIIIPTYNEKNNIGLVIDKIFELYPDIHVMVVDDNSPDGTSAAVMDLKKKYERLTLHVRPKKLGIASAYLEAITALLNEKRQIRAIITMDADLSHDPAVIRKMLDLLSDFDVIIGSRYINGGALKNWAWWRRALSRLGNIYARLVTGLPIRDLTTGFNCFSGDFLKKCDLTKIHSDGFAFLIELKAVACQA